MAAGAERDMNLAALQQRDPYITSIVDTASQVALYSFNAKNNEWEKTSVEGTLFVYSRSASPINGFMILNRLGLNDLIEPINKNLEFQLQDPFLLYRNEKAFIFGIWFYDKDECARIGQLMNSLVQVASHSHESRDGRQRRASESDTMVDRTGSGSSAGSDAGAGAGGAVLLRGAVGGQGNVDILQMLSKALDEYDKSKPDALWLGEAALPGLPVPPGVPKAEPKPLIDNPNASATTLSDLIRPRAMKVHTGQGASTGSDFEHGAASSGATAGASGTPEPAPLGANVNTLEKLFRQASLHQEAAVGSNTSVAPPGGVPTGQMPLLLQRLMSNPGATVAEIERQQRGEIPRDQMPEPVGEEAPPCGINGVRRSAVPKTQRLEHEEPDSPNTALKRSLNILPPTHKSKPMEQISLSRMPQPSHDHLLRTSTAPALLGSNVPPSSLVRPSAVPSCQGLASRVVAAMSGTASVAVNIPVSSTLQSARHQHPQIRPMEAFEPEIFLTKTVAPDVNMPSVPAASVVRQITKLSTEGLVTPQALLQSASTSLPLSMPSQDSSSHLAQAANILLSPMMFQTSHLTPPLPGSSSLQQPGSDVLSVKSSSPQDPCVDLMGRLPHTPPPSPSTTSANITPLTCDQLQQAMLYLLKNDSKFVATLHEAYVKSLNLATRGSGNDRS